MNALDALRIAWDIGVRVGIEGDDLVLEAAAAPPPDVIDLLSRHKADILQELREAALSDQPQIVPPTATTIAPDEPGNHGEGVVTPEAEARRQRVLAMLADHPEARYAALTDMQADLEAVLLTLAIRGQATCELRIPKEKYDPFLLLDLIERHEAMVH